MADANEARFDAAAARVSEAIVRAGAVFRERRRNMWRTAPMTFEVFQPLFDLPEEHEWSRLFMRVIHEVLLRDYPNDPPPYKMVSNCFDALEVHFHQMDDNEPPWPECKDHESYVQELIERAERLHREVWAAPGPLDVRTYHDLFGLTWCAEESEKFIFDVVRRGFRDTTHPDGPPTAEEFIAAVRTLERIE